MLSPIQKVVQASLSTLPPEIGTRTETETGTRIKKTVVPSNRFLALTVEWAAGAYMAVCALCVCYITLCSYHTQNERFLLAVVYILLLFDCWVTLVVTPEYELHLT